RLPKRYIRDVRNPFIVCNDLEEIFQATASNIIRNVSSLLAGIRIFIQSMVELRYELLQHPPYSPDLAPCDFFLFPNLKKWLGGKKLMSNEEGIAETEAYFAEFDKSYFSEGLKKWQKHWEKCILLKGDYVEK
ncbi:SETMR methyltransferase, partial [Acromyrmex heyeri]